MQKTNLNSVKIDQVMRQARAIEAQVRQLQKMRSNRLKVFKGCMDQYIKYVTKENQLMDRNMKHCQERNIWYRQEINRAWKTAIADRPLVLRSVARTNVLKKDTDEWLSRIDEATMKGERYSDQMSMSRPEEHLEDSQLIEKYNQILLEYGHKI